MKTPYQSLLQAWHVELLRNSTSNLYAEERVDEIIEIRYTEGTAAHSKNVEALPGNIFFGGGEWVPSGGASLNGYYYIWGIDTN